MKYRLAALLLIFLVGGGLVYIFRYSLINAIQQHLIKSISSAATVANRRLLRDTSFARHLVYHLKGTERLWPHRVNSIERFRFLFPEFAGFECDIQFNPATGLLAIGHDRPGSDSLTGYLRADTSQKKLFWLDLKNIDDKNAILFCRRLRELDRQYALKNRIILECYDTLAAEKLIAAGWLTALNVTGMLTSPPPSPADPPSPPPPPLSSPPPLPKNIILLTGETTLHPLIAREYPAIQQLNWDIRFRDGMDRTTLLSHANDTSLLVCLINVKSPGYR